MNAKNSAQILARALADSYVLLAKVQAVHWNVSGPSFFGIHMLTEQQYQELFAAIDEIAERIRALGQPAPGSLAEFIKLSTLGDGISADQDVDMVRALRESHRAIADEMRKSASALENLGDDASHDLLIARVQAHDKAAWMWSAYLGDTELAKKTTLDEFKDAPAKSEEPKKAKAAKKEKKERAQPETRVEEEKNEAPAAAKKMENGKSAKSKEEPEREAGRRRLFSGTRIGG